MTEIFVSATCQGEHCWCGAPAVRKVGEEIPYDDPSGARRHNFTSYICAEHYAQLMGPAGARDVGVDPRALEAQTPSEGEDAQPYKDALHDLVMLKAQQDIGCVPAPTKEQWAKAWAEAEDLVRVEP